MSLNIYTYLSPSFWASLKITKIKPILCDGGFRTWIFVEVETDEGITGYGDASMW